MVKKILILMTFVVMAVGVSAKRVQLGVRVGVSSQDMELQLADLTPLNVLTDSKLGFHFAVVSRIRLAAIGTGVVGLGFYLQPEIVYSQNNYKIKTSNDTRAAKIQMQAIDIPVLFSFKISIVRAYVGPVFNVMYKSPSNRSDVELMTIKPTIGYSAGLSVDIFGGLVLDGRYNGQFKKLQNNLVVDGATIGESVQGSLSGWTLGLSWLF